MSTKNVLYFNNIHDTSLVAAQSNTEYVLQRNDWLSISVSSLSSQAAEVFNAPNFATNISSFSANNHSSVEGYLVSNDGSIRFPMLGNIKAAGLTKKILEEEIAHQLIDRKLLFDPIVNIRHLNFRVTVLGEVGRPGVINVPSEQISILEAIGQAGDITIYGKRENVVLIRQEGDRKTVVRLNLNSSDILQSPYFFLRTNDVLYVEPGKAKAAAGSRGQQLLPAILSAVSIAVVVITKLIK
ncbi:polysaccharide biosynthesis/export family protein [Chitinophagaceae bacterium LB-8]|uniref:Polysaccharide biosynthesis/export family protein n=1 Tax=Paraflavisolibacter caeni TaxID=2982496 RepID=A0A9X2XRT2_9BACT|nr:polysaccharide biosynthesis/export family protein [Paraflavisolibacter caeni]MCU7547496.1 polysaccharide biosynthesis/export family protein [Paraflavisolibacter caeni]